MTRSTQHPTLIQGGMGIGVSNWMLARAVSTLGQLGIVSGTASDTVMVRRLQDGDPEGHVRRALSKFPNQAAVIEVLQRYFRADGRKPSEPYRLLPLYQQVTSIFRQLITAMGTFVEVYLAKEDHDGKVGINLLTKIQLPTLPSIFGALLAKVDYLCMGAGIPKEIPDILTKLTHEEPASLRIEVGGDAAENTAQSHLDPKQLLLGRREILERPCFFPIVSSHSLATMLVRKAPPIDGLVIENHIAGGHNAPPRDSKLQTVHQEPRYGERDAPDFEAIKSLGVPFWIAGGMGQPSAVKDAKRLGAHGVQVGTPFAFCKESGIRTDIKKAAIEEIMSGSARVITDPDSSPTGYPFKVLDLDGTLSQKKVYGERQRNCDLGYLREAYRKSSGKIGFRCPAEPIEDFIAKGGHYEQTIGKKCLCNGLISEVGFPQRQVEMIEPAIVTCGSELRVVSDLISIKGEDYTASDVVDFLTE